MGFFGDKKKKKKPSKRGDKKGHTDSTSGANPKGYKKKDKLHHGKYQKGSKGSKGGGSQGTKGCGRGGERGSKDRHHRDGGQKRRSHQKPKKQYHRQLPPAEENLGGVILVKDRHKKRTPGVQTAASKESLQAVNWRQQQQPQPQPQPQPQLPQAAVFTPNSTTTPDPASRSLEKDNRPPPLPLILGGEMNKEKQLPPLPAGGDGQRSKGQMRSSKDEIKPVPGKSEEKLAAIAATPPKDKGDPSKERPPGPPITETPPKKKKQDPKGFDGADDELTKKEPEEKDHALTREERKKKWRGYAQMMLDGGIEAIGKEFRQVRGHLPVAATRVGFDSHPFDNRFEDIVCIDHTRVEIKDNSYIHANWVEIDKNRKMILTQLPLPHTASHFWQMILETNVQAILVILTNYESDMFNAEATFPAQQDFLHYADRHIRVGEFKKIQVASGWTLNVLSITNGDKKKYLHVHRYTNWCHGQEPKNYTDMLKIHSVFKKYKDPQVVVSLSGCGRAGTYATFEVAHARLHCDTVDKMNVRDAVERVRNSRMHAVQRAAQMKTIHLALLEHVLKNGFIKELSDRQKEAWEELKKLGNELTQSTR